VYEYEDVFQVNSDGSRLFVGAVSQTGTRGGWHTTLQVGNNPVTFKIDSGADVTVITRQTYEMLQPRPTLHSTSSTLMAQSGPIKCLGLFATDVQHKGKMHTLKI
jgi:hypothetical protein